MTLYFYDSSDALARANSAAEALSLIQSSRISGYAGEVTEYREDTGTYTWPELYALALYTAALSPELEAKNCARAAIREKILQETGHDIDEDECPEDSVEDWCAERECVFDDIGMRC